jgi:hypothetical protein
MRCKNFIAVDFSQRKTKKPLGFSQNSQLANLATLKLSDRTTFQQPPPPTKFAIFVSKSYPHEC